MSKPIFSTLFLGALLLGSPSHSRDSSITDFRPDLDIAADSRLFETLRRVQTRSDFLLPWQSFPQRSSAIRRFLEAGPLTSFDRNSAVLGLPGGRQEAIRWRDPGRGNSFYLSPWLESGLDAASEGDSMSNALLTGLGATLYGTFMNRLAFYSRAAAYTEFTDKAQFSHQFSPEYGETYSVEKGADDSLLTDRTFNRFEFYVLSHLSWLTLKAGRDRVHSGPGYFSSLMATRDTPPYYLLEARIDFAPWLRVDNHLLRMTDTDHEIDKYANLHRFEFRPWNWLSLAFQDIVIYQDRDPDWRYALPLAPLAFSEDNNGGTDNDAMGFDFLFSRIPHLSLWGELFLDDLLGPGTFFDDFWQNRWSVLAGFQFVSPITFIDADLVVEYSRVEPWTYLGAKPQTSFKHFNVPSASRLGPDSRSWDFQAAYRPWKWLQIKEHWEIHDKGTGKSSRLGAVHQEGDPEIKEFLAGKLVSTRALTHSFDYYFREYFYLSGFITQNWGNSGGDKFGVKGRLIW